VSPGPSISGSGASAVRAPDESAAVAALGRLTGRSIEVVERITGDEQAFGRDFDPATDAERAATQRILDDVRPQTVEFLRPAPTTCWTGTTRIACCRRMPGGGRCG
jgi:hypothetical protein